MESLENIYRKTLKFQKYKKATPLGILSVALKISELLPPYGAEGGIRTLAPVSRSTPLAGEPLIATWVLLQVLRSANDSVVGEKGGGESGIRTHGSCESLVFKTSSLNHSDISPSLFHRANVILP